MLVQEKHIQEVKIRDVSVDIPVTWEMLCEYAPELMNIRDSAKDYLSGPQNPSFWLNYENLKRRMASCVGMYAHHSHQNMPEYMRSSAAYDLAHNEIFGRWV